MFTYKFVFFQAEDGIRDVAVTGVQTCALPICSHAFTPQRLEARIAEGIVGNPGDVVACDAEMREADGNIRLRAAETGLESRRSEQALLARGGKPQQELAERDGFHARARATLATSARARAVSSAAPGGASSGAETRALPRLTAAAPARIQSPAFSSVTPPDGINRTEGRGASTSRIYEGPTADAGNSLISSAPARCAVRISVGVKAPGT